MIVWLCYFVNATWLLQAFNWTLYARLDSTQEAVEEWALCSAATLNDPDCGPVPRSAKLPYGLLVIYALIEGFTGWWYALAFGNWLQIKKMFKLLRHPKVMASKIFAPTHSITSNKGSGEKTESHPSISQNSTGSRVGAGGA
eukprot:TRINITY_DN7268_c0_g1_i2.p1 TRINITY_DN7268_c0_g1~~TRINITY_DN7268_c0_g1_i2.p1  ORF type:complete len:142 (-),score=18.06 TRINITY_DN7268_c0_g1_i2:222-647(-)